MYKSLVRNNYIEISSPWYIRIGGKGTLRRDWIGHWVLELFYFNRRKSYHPDDFSDTRKEINFGIFKLLESYEGGDTSKFKKRGFYNMFLIN